MNSASVVPILIYRLAARSAWGVSIILAGTLLLTLSGDSAVQAIAIPQTCRSGLTVTQPTPQGRVQPGTRALVADSIGPRSLPLAFVENRGQFHGGIEFHGRRAGVRLAGAAGRRLRPSVRRPVPAAGHRRLSAFRWGDQLLDLRRQRGEPIVRRDHNIHDVGRL